MGKMSEFFGGGGSGVGLGQSCVFPMYAGGFSPVTVGTQTYLASGTYTAPTNADSSVLAMDHLKLYSTTQSASSVLTRGATRVASNGSGTCVAVDGDGTSVSYSTNNGATWTNVVVGSGSKYTFVIWTGSRFVIASIGASPGSIMIYQSTNGSTWTAGTGTIPSYTEAATSLITDGAGRVLYLTGSSTGYVSTDHGVTWSSYAGSFAAWYGMVVNGLWVFFNNSTTSTYYTAPVATPGTQTARTFPVQAGFSTSSFVSNNSGLGAVILSSGATVYTTTNGTSWTATRPNLYTINRAFWSGSAFYLSSNGVQPNALDYGYTPFVIYRTTDFSTYTLIFLVPAVIGSDSATSAVTGYFGGVGSDNRLFFCSFYSAGTQTKAVSYWQYTTTADFIGTNFSMTQAAAGSATNRIYWRIK